MQFIKLILIAILFCVNASCVFTGRENVCSGFGDKLIQGELLECPVEKLTITGQGKQIEIRDVDSIVFFMNSFVGSEIERIEPGTTYYLEIHLHSGDKSIFSMYVPDENGVTVGYPIDEDDVTRYIYVRWGDD